jgi:acyl dehydratase
MTNVQQMTITNDGYMPKPALSVSAYRTKIGREVGCSDWIRIDQAMIDAFASLTGDNQFIHIDPDRARKSALGGTVAHGFLTLAIIGGQGPKQMPPVEGAEIGLNYGFNKIRLIHHLPGSSSPMLSSANPIRCCLLTRSRSRSMATTSRLW